MKRCADTVEMSGSAGGRTSSRIDRVIRLISVSSLVVFTVLQVIRPLPPGTSVSETMYLSEPACWNSWMVGKGDYAWRGDVPSTFAGRKALVGTLRVIDEERALFSTNGVQIEMWGGKHPFFTLECTLP
jgi:hypothetical protein